MESELSSSRAAAQRRAKYFTGLVWHIGAFVIINAFFWLMDLTLGQGGLQWAFWITVAWGFALLFHVLAWFVDGRQLERRRAERSVDQDRRAAH